MQKKLLERVLALQKLFEQGAIPTLAQHEVNPGLPASDRLNYLYFTLPVSINFQRSSPAMWKSALATYSNPQTNYLFYPEQVVKKSRDVVQQDLAKHKLSLQKNKHTDIWIRLSQVFNSKYEADPRRLFSELNFDAGRILKHLQVEHKKDYPYLSGTKIAPYWLFILLKYTDLKLQNTAAISIIPDTHIIQASVQLGISRPGSSSVQVAADWFELLKGSGYEPHTFHSMLWNWSRNNFLPQV